MAGKPAVADLERAMTEILECFRTGSNSLWSSLFAPRIDRIVLAATKADHLHHHSHDRLEAILAKLAGRAMARAQYAGAEVKVLALAAIRATREGEARSGTARGFPASSATRCPAKRSASAISTATRNSRSFPATFPPIRRPL